MTFSFTINLLCDLVRLFDLSVPWVSYPEKWCQLTILYPSQGQCKRVSEVSQVDHEHLYRPVSPRLRRRQKFGQRLRLQPTLLGGLPAGARGSARPSAKFGGKQRSLLESRTSTLTSVFPHPPN